MATTERYRAKCLVCGFGNCQAALTVCPRDVVDSFAYAIEGLRRNLAAHVPNRLFGVEINREGDAI